jgi:hypothetical protein
MKIMEISESVCGIWESDRWFCNLGEMVDEP